MLGTPGPPAHYPAHQPNGAMTITNIKRCQHNPNWWFTVEDCYTEVLEDQGTGLTIKYHEPGDEAGKMKLSMGIQDALLLRDAINQLYPPETFPSI